MRLADQVAIITGGASGIGRATALRFADEGAKVVIANRTQKTGEEIVSRIADAGGQAVWVRTDVSVEADAKRIRAEGDRAAAEFYAVFGRNPELAVFLRKLDSLRLTLSEKTTLVVDTRTPPFDLLLPDATDLKKAARALPPAAVDGGDPE